MKRNRFTTDVPGEDVEIAGIRYQPNNSRRAYRVIRPEGSGAVTDWATLEPDPRNHYDSYAVEVRVFGRKVGYLPAPTARKYQNYTMEADRKNEPIEVPVRLRGRNYRDEFKVLGSIYLPDLSVLAERFPNLEPEDPSDDAIPEWADSGQLRRRDNNRRQSARPRVSPAQGRTNTSGATKDSGGGWCLGIFGLLVLLITAAFVIPMLGEDSEAEASLDRARSTCSAQTDGVVQADDRAVNTSNIEAAECMANQLGAPDSAWDEIRQAAPRGDTGETSWDDHAALVVSDDRFHVVYIVD